MKSIPLFLGRPAAVLTALILASSATLARADEGCVPKLNELNAKVTALTEASETLGFAKTYESLKGSADSQLAELGGVEYVQKQFDKAKFEYEVARSKLFICIVPLPPVETR